MPTLDQLGERVVAAAARALVVDGADRERERVVAGRVVVASAAAPRLPAAATTRMPWK